MAPKSETYDVNKFLRLIKEHKATATRINELVEIIHAQQHGRASLGELRTNLCACTENYKQYEEYYNSTKNSLADLAIQYFVLSTPLEVKKRRTIVKQMQSTAIETRNWEAKMYVWKNEMNNIEEKIESITSTLGDCDTSLELALDEYRTAVTEYNAVAEKLSKFKGVNIPQHPELEIVKAKSYDINNNFGEDDNADVLV